MNPARPPATHRKPCGTCIGKGCSTGETPPGLSRRDFLRVLGSAGAVALTPDLPMMLQGTLTGEHRTALPALSEISAELHVLKRLTWGPRQQDLDAITARGIAGYIDWQLDFENIPDPVVDAFMATRAVMTASQTELTRIASENYGYVFETALWTRLYRAIYSERGLYEHMVEFWTDHFNIPIPDLLTEKIVDDRAVIRQHALGRFRDILLASATSPAMLRYLDQAVSTSEHPNENYAREIMELHTLGADGGYTESDVVEVARALTGITLNERGEFFFDRSIHDEGVKTILDVHFPAGRGIEDPLQVIDLLARHPSTAHFIAHKLCCRFVSDTPPDSLVRSAEVVFSTSEGDLRAVMRHILNSDEFRNNRGSKFRRPLEVLIAMLRALAPAVSLESPGSLIYSLEPLGHIPYHWFPPDGYPDHAEAWINTNGLLQRWNLALTLSRAGEGAFDGVHLNLDRLIAPAATVGELVSTVIARLLHTPVNPEDYLSLVSYMTPSGNPDDPVTDSLRAARLPGLVGMILASPYFQWH